MRVSTGDAEDVKEPRRLDLGRPRNVVHALCAKPPRGDREVTSMRQASITPIPGGPMRFAHIVPPEREARRFLKAPDLPKTSN